MKHAVLIIAHKNMDQLIRLVKSLQDDELDVYIHLDKKWRITEEEIQRVKSISNNVTIMDVRISAFLDTWSLCEVTLELINTALSSGKDYAYFMLLSGQDYPIKPISYIKEYLGNAYPKPLIDCTPLRKNNWIYSGFKWIRFHWYYRLVERLTKKRKLRKLLLFPAYGVQALTTWLLRSPYNRLKKQNCELYGGSAWWILPKEVVQLCVSEWKSNSKIIKAFKLKNTPEETFFQTMAMQSKYRDCVEINDPYEVLQNCMTYAYFFDEGHPATGHPYILTKENFDMLSNRNELFARKFDCNVDDEILDLIDSEILKGDN